MEFSIQKEVAGVGVYLSGLYVLVFEFESATEPDHIVLELPAIGPRAFSDCVADVQQLPILKICRC